MEEDVLIYLENPVDSVNTARVIRLVTLNPKRNLIIFVNKLNKTAILALLLYWLHLIPRHNSELRLGRCRIVDNEYWI